MSQQVSLKAERSAHSLTSLTASIGWQKSIVFNEGTLYHPLGSDDGGREVDEYLTVAEEERERLGTAVGAAGLTDDDLLATFQRTAAQQGWTSLDHIRSWLNQHNIPFKASRWIDRD